MPNQEDKPIESFESFEQFFEQVEKRDGYWEERAKLEFTREVVDRMQQSNVSKSELALRLEAKPSFVTRLLNGRNNFEIATMVRLARALKCRFRTHLQPDGADTLWVDVVNVTPQSDACATWNPDEFSSVTLYLPQMKHSNYEACPLAA